MVFASSQSWPLSKNANKRSGVCSICQATRQLHLKDGTVHVHGPRKRPCPGSDKPPLGPSVVVSSASSPCPSLLVASSAALTAGCPTGSNRGPRPLLSLAPSDGLSSSATSS